MTAPRAAPQGAEVLPALADVAARHRQVPLADRLAALQSWLGDDLAALSGAVDEVLDGARGLPGARVAGAASHLLARHGKRLRPVCVLLGARMGPKAPPPETTRAVALAIELVHAATLLHDDVIDDSAERRGAAASRVLFGNSASILAGDHLLTHALQRVAWTDEHALLSGLLATIAAMVAAEARQLERRGRLDLDRDAYVQVIRGKTAGLFAWGLAAGGSLSAAGDAHVATLRDVGERLGVAFQLVDDVLDLGGDPATTGKSGLADLRQGKLTWPIILACEADAELADALRRLVATRPDVEPEPGAMAAWVTRLRATEALQRTRQLARQEADAACAAIAGLPEGPARAALGAVVAAAVERIA